MQDPLDDVAEEDEDNVPSMRGRPLRVSYTSPLLV
jgi:hypothetical protein